MRDKCEMYVSIDVHVHKGKKVENYSIYMWMRVQLPLSSIVVISRCACVRVFVQRQWVCMIEGNLKCLITFIYHICLASVKLYTCSQWREWESSFWWWDYKSLSPLFSIYNLPPPFIPLHCRYWGAHFFCYRCRRRRHHSKKYGILSLLTQSHTYMHTH